MDSSDYYKINSPSVVYESFDDEVVIINLDSGNYFSINQVGMEIWKGLINGNKADSIIKSVLEIYDTGENTGKNAVHQFIKDLTENEIIVAVESGKNNGSSPGSSSETENSPDKKQPFTLPQLNIYTDMQELLLLDPIHDVDDTGWPQVEEPQSKR